MCYKYLCKLLNICVVHKLGLFGKRPIRPQTDIIIIQLIFPILENGVEVYHAQFCQQSHRCDKACDNPCGEGPAGESKEENFVPMFVVACKKRKGLANIFGDASTSGFTQP